MTRRRRRHTRAFTLLELIIAAAMMAVLSLSLYAALRVGLKARDRALSAVGPARSAEATMDIVRRDLESALPIKGIFAGQANFIGDVGTEAPGTSIVEFYAIGARPQLVDAAGAPLTGGAVTGGSVPSSPPSVMDRQDTTANGGMERVDLLVRAGSTNNPYDSVLVRRVTRNLLAPIDEPPDERVICRGITAFTISYYDGSQWHDTWDSTQYADCLPMALKVSLEITAPKDPTRAGAAPPVPGTPLASAGYEVYRTTRTFFLPCSDTTSLLQGGAQ
jgi:prepilin-type N-terminal cleavage/methylation domain-containing protein